jgi:hypothetical protein
MSTATVPPFCVQRVLADHGQVSPASPHWKAKPSWREVEDDTMKPLPHRCGVHHTGGPSGYVQVSSPDLPDLRTHRRQTPTALEMPGARPRPTVAAGTDRERTFHLVGKGENACLLSALLSTPIRVEPEMMEG